MSDTTMHATERHDRQMEAIGRSQAIIEFDLNGVILDANDNFCQAMGYRLEEIQGQHHRMFVDPEEASSDAYRAFWADLTAGQSATGEFRRFARGGREIWIQASYNVLFDDDGRPCGVMKVASDITAQKEQSLSLAAEAQKVSEMMRQLPLNVMLVDENLVLTYMNDTSYNTLRQIEHNLPVRVDDMIGTCIDVFHKKPETQRQILSDPKRNLPHKAEIVIGGEDVSLQADGVYDQSGKFIGCMATWSIISDQKKLEREQAEAQERERAQAEELRQRVDALLDVTNAAAAGDLTVEVPAWNDDSALDNLAGGFREMISGISTVLQEVRSGSNQIDQGSNQIAGASQSLSDGASTQASSLEQISASLEEMSSMTDRNAENCRQAAGLSEECQKTAESGSSEMQNMTAAMDEIKKSSGEISKIIKVIDEIAFQTNLLALNAAVEAARAGEAGKGFAVVAEEVRNLAQRSAEAAKNTAVMIEESTKRAENGVTLAGSVDKSLAAIVESIDKVNTLVSEIAAASQEQSDGIRQVNGGVAELDRVTQQNAGNAEALASSAEQTAAQVGSLRQLISRFTVTDGDEPVASASPATRRPVTAPAAPQHPSVAPASQPSNRPSGCPSASEVIPFGDDDDLGSF